MSVPDAAWNPDSVEARLAALEARIARLEEAMPNADKIIAVFRALAEPEGGVPQ